LALRGIHRDDVCWKLLLSRLENKEVTDLGEVVHIAYLALGQTAGRKTKQMRKVWKHLSGLIEEKVREATEDEIVAVLKDCLWLNARDLNPDMVRIVINSPDPQKIIERIKDFHFGYTTFNGMIMDVERHLQEDKSHP
jgi:hypothetical protein